MPETAFVSWSGGKDSALAFSRARQAGLQVRTLLTMFEEGGERSRSHGLPAALLAAQARSVGCEWRSRTTTWQGYETAFIEELTHLRGAGHTVGIFGDIDLVAHREWEEKVCAAAGINARLPLWQAPRHALVDEMFACGLRAVVVCTDGRFLGPEFCGRNYDREFVASLPAGVDACGENGEFHTFVHDGPGFQFPVPFEITGYSDYVSPAEWGSVPYRFALLRPRSDS